MTQFNRIIFLCADLYIFSYMARKCKITDNIIRLCSENIRLGFTYAACAKAINISYETWANWTKHGKEGKDPYAKWYIAIQEAEAELMKECLESVKLSMKLGDVKSAMFLLERRFGSEGYGKQSQVDINAKSESVNVHVTPSLSSEEADKIRKEILEKLSRPAYPERLNVTNSREY